MPIYEYRCQSCAKELEVLVRGGHEPEHCPDCQGALARKISRAGVIFKGSGFYVTDSRSSSGSGGDKKNTSNPKTDGGGDSSSSSESKTAESKTSEGKSGVDSGGSSKKTETAKKSSD